MGRWQGPGPTLEHSPPLTFSGHPSTFVAPNVEAPESQALCASTELNTNENECVNCDLLIAEQMLNQLLCLLIS